MWRGREGGEVERPMTCMKREGEGGGRGGDMLKQHLLDRWGLASDFLPRPEPKKTVSITTRVSRMNQSDGGRKQLFTFSFAGFLEIHIKSMLHLDGNRDFWK